MKKYLLPALFVLSIIAGRRFLSSQVAPPPELPKYNYLSCIGDARDLEVTYKASFYLAKRAFNGTIDQDVLWSAAWRENRYAFENQLKYSPSLAKTIAVGNEEIKNISYEETSYPQDVILPSPGESHFFPEADREFKERLFQLKELKKGEPAIRVTYEISQTIYTCHGKGVNFVPADLKFYIPADPYVASTYFPENEWPTIFLPRHGTSTRMNPCFTKDMAHPVKKSNPLSFGFGWLPFEKGRDINGREYDCSQYYRLGESIFEISPTFKEKNPEKVADLNFSWFEDLKRPLRASVLFGAMDNLKFTPLDPEEAKTYVRTYFSEISIGEAKKKLPLDNERIDKTFSRVLMFLRNLRTHIDPRDFTVDATPSMVQIKLRGKFRLSKKDIELFIHFSPNFPGVPGYEEFESALSSQLLKSDILVYDGHTASGKPLYGAFKKVSDLLKSSPQVPHPAYQIMAVLSCSANGTYRSDVVPLPVGMKRDLVYGAGEYLDGPAHGSLSFIVAADKYLYNKRIPYFGHWASYFQSDNSYLLQNQR